MASSLPPVADAVAKATGQWGKAYGFMTPGMHIFPCYSRVGKPKVYFKKKKAEKLIGLSPRSETFLPPLCSPPPKGFLDHVDTLQTSVERESKK